MPYNGSKLLIASQVSVGTTATLLAAARYGRKQITIVNHGTTDVFIGGTAAVTTGTGVKVSGTLANVSSVLEFDVYGPVYAITASGTQVVGVVEVLD